MRGVHWGGPLEFDNWTGTKGDPLDGRVIMLSLLFHSQHSLSIAYVLVFYVSVILSQEFFVQFVNHTTPYLAIHMV